MVAITVILAAVIATFVLGLGDSVSNTAPQASFSFNADGDSGNTVDPVGTSSAETIDVTHTGGETLDVDDIKVVENGTSEDLTTASLSNSELTAGSTFGVEVGSASAAEIRIVYDDPESDNTATLATYNT